MAKKYDVLQWMMVQMTGVGPMFGQYTHFKLFAPKDKDNSYSMGRYQTEVKRLYEVLEKRLAKRPISAATNTPSPTSRRSRGRAITKCRT